MQIWKFSPIGICSVVIWPSAPPISLETVLACGLRVPATGVVLCRCKVLVSDSQFVNGLTVGRGSCCSVEVNWGASGQGPGPSGQGTGRPSQVVFVRGVLEERGEVGQIFKPNSQRV